MTSAEDGKNIGLLADMFMTAAQVMEDPDASSDDLEKFTTAASLVGLYITEVNDNPQSSPFTPKLNKLETDVRKAIRKLSGPLQKGMLILFKDALSKNTANEQAYTDAADDRDFYRSLDYTEEGDEYILDPVNNKHLLGLVDKDKATEARNVCNGLVDV